MNDFQERDTQAAELWDYEQSDFEQAKYEATLAACGDGPFNHALELGGSIGVFTEMLAPRCHLLTTIDVAATAAEMARRRLSEFPQVSVIRGAIPAAVPNDEFDLIVASEILYHLDPDDLERALGLIRARLVRGGRLVAVHWRPPVSDRSFDPAAVHARLRDDPWLSPVYTEESGVYLLDALDRA